MPSPNSEHLPDGARLRAFDPKLSICLGSTRTISLAAGSRHFGGPYRASRSVRRDCEPTSRNRRVDHNGVAHMNDNPPSKFGVHRQCSTGSWRKYFFESRRRCFGLLLSLRGRLRQLSPDAAARYSAVANTPRTTHGACETNRAGVFHSVQPRPRQFGRPALAETGRGTELPFLPD